MSDCCAHSSCDKTPPKTAVCPRNGHSYAGVAMRTVLHQVRQPWSRDITKQAYYFCDDPDCDVVYFGEDLSLLMRDDLRNTVGQKSKTSDKTLCYCFDIDAAALLTREEQQRARAFVIEQTRNANCDCETRNPSGRCCLKNFPHD